MFFRKLSVICGLFLWLSPILFDVKFGLLGGDDPMPPALVYTCLIQFKSDIRERHSFCGAHIVAMVLVVALSIHCSILEMLLVYNQLNKLSDQN